jgi:transposase
MRFSLNPNPPVYVKLGVTDLRLSYEGLFNIARHQMNKEPRSGSFFVFANRARHRIKVLFFDGSGLWCCAKRLEKGSFNYPRVHSEIDATQFHALIHGLEFKHREGWYREPATVAPPSESSPALTRH